MRFVDDSVRFVELQLMKEKGLGRNRRMTVIKPKNFSSSFGKKTPGALLPALAAILLLFAMSQEAEAQVLMVGSNSSGQTTNFTSGTNNFGAAYIGATATDSNNTLNVFNPGTRLTITTNIQVGFAGNNNSMVISNGGFVSDATGVISYGNSGVNSNNSALVTGAGSTWSNSTQVRLGVSGQGTLTVANGGSVVATGVNGIQTAVNAGSVGVLNIGSYGGNDSAGSIVAPKIAFGAGTGTLNFNQTNTTTLTNAILGTGIVQQLGSGTTILTYSGNTWSAGTVITNGALQIGDGGANGSIGNGAISNNSVLAFNSASTITLANSQSIKGTGALIQMGTGTTILNAANTTYSGGTLISGGTLQVGVVGGAGDTNGSLGTGNVTNNATLAFSRRFASDTVSNNISGTGALTMFGSSGALTLAGSNSYAGLTTIDSAYRLLIGTGSTNGTLGTGSVSNAGILSFNRSDLYTASNTISGSGLLFQIGSGTTILSGSNSYSGGTTVTNGMLQIGNGGTTGSVGSGVITLSGGVILAFNRADSVTLTNNIGGGGGVLSQMGAGTLVITGYATYGQTVISNGTLQIGDGGANGAIGSGAITNNSVLAVNSSTNITFGSGNGIRGTGALIQMGTGTTIIDAANTTYSGGTLISGGTLQVGIGDLYNDTFGSLGTGAVTNNATLAFKRSLQSDTVSNNISGTGALTILGSGETLILAGSNSYSGLTTITSNNALQIGTGSTNGTLGSGSVSNAGTLKFNRSDLYTVTNTISGSGNLSQIGSGTTILSGSNNYTGVTTITNGTLLANNTTGSAVGTNTVNVSSGGSLGGNGTIGGSTYITSSSLIPGSGGLSGSGTLTFTKGLTLQSGATTSFLINATNNFTSINLSGGSVTYGGTLSFNLTSYAPVAVAGNIFTLFNLTNGATETGDFTSLSAIGDTISFTNNAGVWTGSDTYGSTYQFSVATGQLSVASTVPEPSTYALFGLGALALIISYRARSRRVA